MCFDFGHCACDPPNLGGVKHLGDPWNQNTWHSPPKKRGLVDSLYPSQ